MTDSWNRQRGQCHKSAGFWVFTFLFLLQQFICLINFVNISTKGESREGERDTHLIILFGSSLPGRPRPQGWANSLCTSPKINGRRVRRKSLTNFLMPPLLPYLYVDMLRSRTNHWTLLNHREGLVLPTQMYACFNVRPFNLKLE